MDGRHRRTCIRQIRERKWMMKKVAKIMEILGILLLFVGGGSMDSASIVLPIVMAFSGLAIAFSGAALEEQWT